MGYIRKKYVITDTDMLRDGKCPYSIVLSGRASETEKFAAKELATLFKESTGYILPVVGDEKANYDVKAYYFSIGETSLFETLKKDPAFLNEETHPFGDNVRLFSKGNMIFFAGNGKGPILSVYEFFAMHFGYKYYARDEYSVDKRTELKVPVFDVEYHPDFPRRALGFFDTERDETHINRLKLCNTLYSGWIAFAHTYFKLLPKSKYYDKHPSWYSPDGKNLCLSNSEMKEEFVKAVEEKIENSSEELFMLGQEDTFEFCSCEKCRKKIAEYGGRSSGLTMEFTNDVAREVGAWLKEKRIERKVKFVAFAYKSTFEPPARYDDAKGKYVPMKKAVKAEENVAVMIVPYIALYSASFIRGEMNKHIRDAMYGWQAVADDLMIWQYSTIFENYMIPFNNFRFVKENYGALRDMGVSFLYDEGPHNSRICSFDSLRQYVQSALLYGTDKTTEQLIDEFCSAYYGEAAPCMKYVLEMQTAREYFNEGYYKKYCGYSFDSFRELMDGKLWTKEYLDLLEEIFSKARKSIENSARKEILADRIEKEYLSVTFFRLRLYPETLADREKTQKDFDELLKKHGIDRLSE